MKITRQQNFSIDFFEFEDNGYKYRVGLGNYKDQGPGCEIFYPETGSEYMLIIYDNGWYKFDMQEFTHTAGIYYICEKLKCNRQDAVAIHKFVNAVLNSEAALGLLADNRAIKNPMLADHGN